MKIKLIVLETCLRLQAVDPSVLTTVLAVLAGA